MNLSFLTQVIFQFSVIWAWSESKPRTFLRPMHQDGESYSKQSGDHQAEAKFMLEKYQSKLKWGKDETAIDLGCGPGDVTINVLLPVIEKNITCLVGMDVNPTMVDFAKKKWQCQKKVVFKLGDVSAPNLAKEQGTFNKVFSFMALQWVPDQKQVAKNIYELLKPGGQAFVLIVACSGIYKVFDEMVKNPKWNEYLKCAPKQYNQYVYMNDRLGKFKEFMTSGGLCVDTADLMERKNIFKSSGDTDEMIERIKSVDPNLNHIPKDKQKEYLTDVLCLLKETVSPTGANDYISIAAVLSRPV